MDQGKTLLLLTASDLHLKILSGQRFSIVLRRVKTTKLLRQEKTEAERLEIHLFPVPAGLPSARLLPLTMRPGFADAVKQLLCGFSADSAKEKDWGVQRSHSWEPVKMQAHPRPKAERDAAFARQKAQRASLRARLREKYNLPKDPVDEKHLEAVGAKPQLPRDLLSIVQPSAASPVPPTLPSFGGLDFDSFQATLQSPAQSFPRLGSCRLM